MDLLVLAKEPVPGRSKTRLTPPCTPREAAWLAEAALADTLAAAVASGADRVVLGLDGDVGPWCPSGIVVVDQGDGDLSERLERLWSHASGPGLQIGMDTPQADAEVLARAMGRLTEPGVDAVLGAAEDGGWWAVGLRAPRAGVFTGIGTSCPTTGTEQRRRLDDLGLHTVDLPRMRDVDHWDDAAAVAALVPHSAFARAQRAVAERIGALAVTR